MLELLHTVRVVGAFCTGLGLFEFPHRVRVVGVSFDKIGFHPSNRSSLLSELNPGKGGGKLAKASELAS